MIRFFRLDFLDWGPSNPRPMFTPDKYCQYYIIIITIQISPDPLNKNS